MGLPSFRKLGRQYILRWNGSACVSAQNGGLPMKLKVQLVG
jgi:hypothetical protein